jgi:hypothetical protein
MFGTEIGSKSNHLSLISMYMCMTEQRITYMIDSHLFPALWLHVEWCGMMEMIFDNLIDDFLEEMKIYMKASW